MPVFGIGTWALRGETAEQIVRDALVLGVRHVDTARMYENEQRVGAGIRASGVPREEIFLTTKILPGELGADDVVRAAEDSLAKLDAGHIDLLLIHWPNPDVPLAETLDALTRLKRRGVTRHIGVSNFTAALVDEAVATCDEPLVTNQVEFHPYLDQRRLLETCRRHGMALTAYSPLAKGRIRDDRVVKDVAAAHNRSAAQVALRWLVQHEDVAVIPRSSKRERLIENASIFDFKLSGAEMQRISALARVDGRLTNSAFSPTWD